MKKPRRKSKGSSSWVAKKGKKTVMPARPSSKVSNSSPEDETLPPRSMIVRRGRASALASELVNDLRQMMAPNTAERLRSTTTSMKDLVKAAGVLKMSHLLMVSQAKHDGPLSLRVARLPQGPTLTFRVASFQLSRHVREEQKRPATTATLTTPLLVANNFSRAKAPHAKLVRVTLEAMFPVLDVTRVKLNDCRRVVLCHLVQDDVVEIRHYLVKADAAGLASKAVKDLVSNTNRPPDLGKLDDVADYVLGQQSSQDSNVVVLPEKYVGRGNARNRASSIALVEIGPRLTLQLVRVEADLQGAQGISKNSSETGRGSDVLYQAPSENRVLLQSAVDDDDDDEDIP